MTRTGPPARVDEVAAGLLPILTSVGRRFDPDCGVESGVLLSRPGDAVVCRVGSVVVKAHAPGTNRIALGARLAVTADPATAGVLLTALTSEPVRAGGRWVSVWPLGRTVPRDPAGVPWSSAARVLAALHTVPRAVPALGRLPATGAPARMRGVLAGLAASGHDDARAAVIRAAWRGLPAWVRGVAADPHPAVVVHGDWHLGQLVSVPDGSWRLTDVDDLGIGSPVWDFGRLAAFRALGVVREGEFRDFLDAYWAAGGPALRPGFGALPGDRYGWAALDAVARGCVVTGAARGLARLGPDPVPPDDITALFLDVCASLAQRP